MIFDHESIFRGNNIDHDSFVVEYKYAKEKMVLNKNFQLLDLDFNPMTLILNLGLGIVIICLRAQVPSSSSSKVIVWTDK